MAEIYNEARFNQRFDFSNLSWKHINISDKDMCFVINTLDEEELYINLEVKVDNGSDKNSFETFKTSRQSRMYTYPVEMDKTHKTMSIFAYHNVPVNQEISFDKCFIHAVYLYDPELMQCEWKLLNDEYISVLYFLKQLIGFKFSGKYVIGVKYKEGEFQYAIAPEENEGKWTTPDINKATLYEDATLFDKYILARYKKEFNIENKYIKIGVHDE